MKAQQNQLKPLHPNHSSSIVSSAVIKLILFHSARFKMERRLTLLSLSGTQGVALLEMAILIPFILLLSSSMIFLGQIYLGSSKVNSIIDDSLRSFVLTESEGSWPEELNLLANELSDRLLKISSNPPPQIMIAMATTIDDRLDVINGISRKVFPSTNPAIGPIDLQILNSALLETITTLRSQASGPNPPDLTGLTLTKVILPTKSLPMNLGLELTWPTIHQRLAFINIRHQF